MLGKLKIIIENSFDNSKDRRKIIVNHEPIGDTEVLYPKYSGKINAKEYLLGKTDSLTLYIDAAAASTGSCSILLPKTAGARFIAEGKSDFVFKQDKAGQKIKMSAGQSPWRLVITPPPTLLTLPVEPPPDQVVIGDEGSGESR
jgi:hypothetical protein